MNTNDYLNRYKAEQKQLTQVDSDEQLNDPYYQRRNDAWLNRVGYTPLQYKQTLLFVKAMHHTNALDTGYHLNDEHRPPYKVMGDDYVGKLSEFTIYNWLEMHGLHSTQPTLDVNPSQNIGDVGSDLNADGQHIEVKAMSQYSGSLMLECHKWQNHGGHVYNIDSHGKMTGKMPDMFIATHVDENVTTDKYHGRYMKLNKYNYDKLFKTIALRPVKAKPFATLNPEKLVYAVKNGYSRFDDYVPTSHDKWRTGKPQPLHTSNWTFPTKNAYLNPNVVRGKHIIYADGLKSGLERLERNIGPVNRANDLVRKEDKNMKTELESYATETDPENPLNPLYVGQGDIIDPFSKKKNQLKGGEICYKAEIFADKKLMHVDWKQVSSHQGKILQRHHSSVIADSPRQLKKDALSENPSKLKLVRDASHRIPKENYDGTDYSKVYDAMSTKLSALKHHKLITDYATPKQFNKLDTDYVSQIIKGRIDDDIKNGRKKNVVNPAPKVVYRWDNDKYKDLVAEFNRDGNDTNELQKTISSTKNGMQYYDKYADRWQKVAQYKKQHDPKRQLNRPRKIIRHVQTTGPEL